MAETDGDTVPVGRKGKGRGLFFFVKLAVIVLVLAAGGGAGWYFFLGGRAHFVKETKVAPEPPMPFFVEIKPFVVTMRASDGAAHYVQMGVNLKMAKQAAGAAITAVLPEVQDAIRQTVLGNNIEDIETPAGVDTLRGALVKQINIVLVHALGAERVKRILGPGGKDDLVQNIYFTTLVVE